MNEHIEYLTRIAQSSSLLAEKARRELTRLGFPVTKGDVEGHEFHGNQYEGGSGGQATSGLGHGGIDDPGWRGDGPRAAQAVSEAPVGRQLRVLTDAVKTSLDHGGYLDSQRESGMRAPSLTVTRVTTGSGFGDDGWVLVSPHGNASDSDARTSAAEYARAHLIGAGYGNYFTVGPVRDDVSPMNSFTISLKVPSN